MNLERLGQNGADRQTRAERADRILKNYRNLPSQRSQLRRPAAENLLSGKADRATFGRNEAGNCERHGALSGAGFADNGKGLALRHGKETSSTASMEDGSAFEGCEQGGLAADS